MTFNNVLFILKAAGTTIKLSGLSFLGGLVLAVFIAFLSMSKFKLFNLIATIYIQITRGTPLLMQLFFIYFSLPQIGIQLSILTSALVALITNTGAFMAEIIRSSIQSVKKGQWDASLSLGLSSLQMMTRIILPQAIRIAIPPTIGYITALIKNSSVASTIGLLEITRAGRLVTEQTGMGLLAFFFVGLVYFLICYPISKLSQQLEKRIE